MPNELPLSYACLLGLVALQRIAELAWSRRNLRASRGGAAASIERDASVGASDSRGASGPARSQHDAPRENARAPRAEGALGFAAMVAVHAASIVLPAIEVAVRGPRAPAPVWIGALALLAAAQALRYAAIRALGASWNVRAEVAPTTRVVTSGPYRWIRHPNYLAVCIELVTIPAIGGAWISLVALQLAHAPILARRIRAEEALLRALPGYAAMETRGALVPRWRRARSLGVERR